MPGLEQRLECPGCGNSKFETIFERPYEDADLKSFLMSYYTKYDTSILAKETYRLSKCPNCTLVFQTFVPDNEMLEVVYDQWIGITSNTNNSPFRPSIKSRDAHELMAIAKHFRTPLDQLTVLDYGMGLAKWCQTAQMLGCNVSGFDLAESRMEHARNLGINAVDWEEMAQQKVDFVNTEQVFEHLVDPFEIITQLASALRPGGVLKISVPFANAIEKRLRNPQWSARKQTNQSLNPVSPLEHVNCWSFQSVKELAARVGLTPIKRSIMCDLAFLGTPKSIPLSPKKLARSLFRPAYKRWYPHKLYCWLGKPR